MPLHATLDPRDIHVPYQWEYANATAREAATGFLSSDIGKLARQLDTNCLWMLTATDPVWQSCSGGTPSTTIFGSQAAQEESLDESTVTGTTNYQQKLRLSVTGVPAGTYRIGWGFTWSYSASNNSFLSRVQLDDTDTLMETEERPASNAPGQKFPTSGFACVTLTEGNHYFDLDFATLASGNTSTIRQARLEFWRLS